MVGGAHVREGVVGAHGHVADVLHIAGIAANAVLGVHVHEDDLGPQLGGMGGGAQAGGAASAHHEVAVVGGGNGLVGASPVGLVGMGNLGGEAEGAGGEGGGAQGGGAEQEAAARKLLSHDGSLPS